MFHIQKYLKSNIKDISKISTKELLGTKGVKK